MASNRGPMVEEAINGMKEYFSSFSSFSSARFYDHTMSVLANSEKIFEGEKVEGHFLASVVSLAGVYHDIGIPESLKKYNSSDAPYQEKEGPPIARDLMKKIGVRPDILERVCYIVGAHHTKEKVDGIDFQILWEADFIVNVLEKNLHFSSEELPAAAKENLMSSTARAIASKLFSLSL